MVTLHSYVLRELLKTFLLALAALTGLFTMAGGIFNVARYEGVTTSDVFKVIHYFIPTAMTFMMTPAALFAAAMVYGRLSADNELTACRAAGINVHRLFRSANLLAIFVTAFTVLFINFIAPSFMHTIETSMRFNLRDMFAEKLQTQGFAHWGKNQEDRYTVTAERCEFVTDEALRAKGFEVGEGLQYLLISDPTFLHVDRHGDLVRFVQARYVLAQFDRRAARLKLTMYARDGVSYEVGKQALEIEQQAFALFPEISLPVRLSSTDLRSLIRWYRHPWETPPLAGQIRALQGSLLRYRYYEAAAERLRAGEALVLTDEIGQSVRVSSPEVRWIKDELRLLPGRVEMRTRGDAEPTVFEAGRVSLAALPLPDGRLMIELRLSPEGSTPVLEYNPVLGREPRIKDKLTLDRIYVPESEATGLQTCTAETLIDPAVAIDLPQGLADDRISLQASAGRWLRKIVATINFRLGYAFCAVATLVMAASLGVVFRGARLLAAFALSLIPFFAVLILLVFGRQLTEKAGVPSPVGPLVTWGGMLCVLLADGLILRLGVRR